MRWRADAGLDRFAYRWQRAFPQIRAGTWGTGKQFHPPMSTSGAQKYGDVGIPARRSRRSRFAYAWSWRRASRTASAFGASLLRFALNDSMNRLVDLSLHVPKARDDRPAAREQKRTRAHAAQRAELECRHRENTALSGVESTNVAKIVLASTEAAIPFRLTSSSAWPLTVTRRIAMTVPFCCMRTIVLSP